MPVWAKQLIAWLARTVGKFAWVRLRAKNRIKHDRCPQCNSASPAAESCPVCKRGTLPTIPVDPVQRVVLWERWLKINPGYRLPHKIVQQTEGEDD